MKSNTKSFLKALKNSKSFLSMRKGQKEKIKKELFPEIADQRQSSCNLINRNNKTIAENTGELIVKTAAEAPSTK